jgi:Glycosyltransferase family 87
MISPSARRWMLVGLLIVLGVLGIVAGRQWARLRIGVTDSNAYWSASHLLSEGRNPVDPTNVLEMERKHHDPNQSSAMMAWNPPTAWVLLLPLAWLPLQVARVIWLLINIALAMGSCILWAGLYLPPRRVAPLAVYSLLAALFAPTLLAIWTGQITFLVVFGVASALFLMGRQQWFWAGASRILTSVKPHLVILVVPYLLLYMAVRRKWSGWLDLVLVG